MRTSPASTSGKVLSCIVAASDQRSRRFVLRAGAGGLLATAISGCTPASKATSPTPTPLSPRSGNRDEVRLGVFGGPSGPATSGAIGEVAAQLFGTSVVGRLAVRVVPVRYTGWPNDLDTQQFVPSHPPALVQRKGPAWQLYTALHSAMTAGEIPDLVLFERMDQVRYAADHQLLLPVDRYLTSGPLPVADAWPGAFDVARYQGQTWVLPLAIQPLVLSYQPAAFQRAGLSAPDSRWDWQRLLAAAKVLTKTAHLAWQTPGAVGGQFGFWVGAPDTLALLVWQAGGEVLAGQGTHLACGLAAPAAVAAELFYFDLVHRDAVSPAQLVTGDFVTPGGQRFGSAAMQFGPANTTNIAVPPRGAVAASGYAFDASGPCLALTARAVDPERAYQVAATLMARTQGRYDWPISQAAANARASSSSQAAVAQQALQTAHAPGRYGDVRTAVEARVAPSLVTALASPSVAVLNGQSLVQDAARSGCTVVDAALRSVE